MTVADAPGRLFLRHALFSTALPCYKGLSLKWTFLSMLHPSHSAIMHLRWKIFEILPLHLSNDCSTCRQMVRSQTVSSRVCNIISKYSLVQYKWPTQVIRCLLNDRFYRESLANDVWRSLKLLSDTLTHELVISSFVQGRHNSSSLISDISRFGYVHCFMKELGGGAALQ